MLQKTWYCRKRELVRSDCTSILSLYTSIHFSRSFIWLCFLLAAMGNLLVVAILPTQGMANVIVTMNAVTNSYLAVHLVLRQERLRGRSRRLESKRKESVGSGWVCYVCLMIAIVDRLFAMLFSYLLNVLRANQQVLPLSSADGIDT